MQAVAFKMLIVKAACASEDSAEKGNRESERLATRTIKWTVRTMPVAANARPRWSFHTLPFKFDSFPLGVWN
jgi:hypothetical protein